MRLSYIKLQKLMIENQMKGSGLMRVAKLHLPTLFQR